MRKIGIVTVFTGYNYGSILQAYSTQKVVESLGYSPKLVWVNSGLVKGRDVRVRKILGILKRAILNPKLFNIVIGAYKSTNNQPHDEESKRKFDLFTEDNLDIERYSYSKLKLISNSGEYKAFICGSDQIWNSTAVYVDPLYYLRFAPKTKRIAYAPSFGKDEVADYNKKIIKKYISDFEHLSIRENQGRKIILSLTGRDSLVALDPTLLLDKTHWKKITNKKSDESYILYYFLNEPNESTKIFLKKIEEITNKKIIVLPKPSKWHGIFNNLEYSPAGPSEFVSLIANADFICTDSFHGVAFSINLNKQFLVFKREYGNTVDQSSRIISLLETLDLKDRFIRNEEFNTKYLNKIEFSNANEKLQNLRDESKQYIKNSIESCM